MKQILLSAGCALLVLSTHAQVNRSTGPTSNSFSEDTHVLRSRSLRGAGGATGTITNQVDTIWYEDFGSGIPNGWTLSGTGSSDCPWVYSTDGSWGFFNDNGGTSGDPGIASTTGANGFLINDPDSANHNMFGQPSGATYQFLETYITTSAIDASGYPAIRLEFEQLFRYNNGPELQVGVSTDGTSFTYYDAKGSVSANDQSENPNLFSVDISSIAGNSPTVYLRFGWSARVYYWMIDDIRLVTPPDYDLAINQDYYNGYTDSTESRYYTAIPVKHANADTILFGAGIENIGGASNSNVALTATVTKDGSQIFQSSSSPITIGQGQFDSLNVTNNFYPTQGIGTYNVRLETTSESADYDSTNSILETSFLVTQNEYRRDNDNSNQGNWFDASTWELAVGFEILEQDTAVAMSCYFPDLPNGYGLDVGDPLSYYLFNSNDMGNPVAAIEFYSATAEDADSWVTLQFHTPVTLTPGLYYAAFKVYTSEVAIGTHAGLNENVPPLAVLNRIDESGPDGWGYRTDMLPFVRLYTLNSELCKNVTIGITGTVTDDTYEGSVEVDVSGGTEPYSYVWSGPNNFTSTSKNISGLDTKGTYTLIVTDSAGCTSDPTDFEVTGAVYTTNVSKKSAEFRTYPNPANNYINLQFVNLSEDLKSSIILSDISGKTILTKELNFSKNNVYQISTDLLNSGIYFITVKTDSGDVITEKITVFH